MNKNIELVLQLIRNSSKENLRKEEYVIALIRTFGLTFEKRPDYGSDDIAFMNDPSVTGIYQTASQFAKYLIFLSTREIRSYLEIGIYQGGSYLFTVTYLSMFVPALQTTALDITPKYMRNDILPYVRITLGTSKMLQGNKYDLVFIDAGHTYEDVKEDYLNVGQFSRICAFHDINNYLCPGVEKFWNEIKPKSEFLFREFTSHSENKKVHGIGIIHQ